MFDAIARSIFVLGESLCDEKSQRCNSKRLLSYATDQIKRTNLSTSLAQVNTFVQAHTHTQAIARAQAQ